MADDGEEFRFEFRRLQRLVTRFHQLLAKTRALDGIEERLAQQSAIKQAFYEVVLRAGLDSGARNRFVVQPGQDHNRDRGSGSVNPLDSFRADAVGQRQVEQHRDEAFLAQKIQTFAECPPQAKAPARKERVRQGFLYQPGVARIVFDLKQDRGRASSTVVYFASSLDGSFTIDNQKSSMLLTTLTNCARLTGFTM